MKNKLIRFTAVVLSPIIIIVGILVATVEKKFPQAITFLIFGLLIGYYALTGKGFGSKKDTFEIAAKDREHKEDIRIAIRSRYIFILVCLVIPIWGAISSLFIYEAYTGLWWFSVSLTVFCIVYYYLFFAVFLHNHGINPVWAFTIIVPLVIMIDTIIRPQKYYMKEPNMQMQSTADRGD